MKKDIVEKQLEAYTDVAADIINGVCFQGEPVIKEEELELEPTTVLVQNGDGEYHERIRDVYFHAKRHGICFAYIGFENQSGIDNTMPLRIMGMDYGSYDRQVKEFQCQNKRRKRLAYTKQVHDEQKLFPVISLVINYGKPWTGPKRLSDMIDFTNCESLRPYIADYPMNLINLRGDKEFYKCLHSDFRLVAQYLSTKDDTKGLHEFMSQEKQGIKHVGAFLDVMSVVSSDKRYAKLKEQVLARKNMEEEVTMCLIADEFENRGMKRGVERGIESTTVICVQNLMKNLKMTAHQAMETLGVPVEKRSKYMELIMK